MRTTELAARLTPAIVCVLSAGAVAHAEATEVEKANARKLFNEALDLRKSGDHKGALDKLEAADAIYATPKGRLELARERQLDGKWVEAYAAYLSVANVAVAPKDEGKYTAHRAEAAKLASDLEPRIPTLKVVVEGVPAGKSALVQIDGAIVPTAALTEPRMVNPGKHTLLARVEGSEVTGEATVKEGDKRVVTLTLPPPKVEVPIAGPAPTSFAAPPSPPPPPTPVSTDDGRTQRTIGLITGGVGVVGLAIGTYFGLSARSKGHDADAYCPTATTCTDARGVTLRADGIHQANLSTVFFVGSTVLLGAGVVLYLTAPTSKSEAKTGLVIGPGSIGLHGRF